MPLYEFQCGSCGHTFELLRRTQDSDDEVECPRCHSARVERQYSTFSSSGCRTTSRGFT